MKSDPTDTHRVLACLGHPSRFRMVKRLSGGDCCVTELAAAVGLSQSCTTRHLQALERAGVVSGARDGKRVLYGLRSDATHLETLLGWALRGERGNGPIAGARAGAGRRIRERVTSMKTDSPPEPIDASEETAEPAAARRPATADMDLEDWLL